ncbi:MAG: methyl-accepting chemotaxis protein [Eubacteriales bacterium]|nr:methyl-accepting chemotaxis protein [Eubacteriales bacterium]
MKWYVNMKIGPKLILGFVVVAIIAGVIGIVGYSSIDEIANTRLPSIQALLTINNAQVKVIVGERGLINDHMTDDDIRQAQYDYIDSAFVTAEETWSEYEALPKTAEEVALWEEFVPTWEEWTAAHEVVYEMAQERDALIESGVSEDDATVTELDEETVAASLTARQRFLASEEILNEIVALNEEAAATSTASATVMILAFAVGGVLISILLGIIISRMISKPVNQTANLATALASGDLDKVIQIKTKDEVGQLATTIDTQVRQAFKDIEKARMVSEKQSKYQSEQVDKLVVNLERLAKGELVCDMSVDEPDEDTQEIYQLFASISDNLHNSINAIKNYIDEISFILNQMSSGNLDVGITSEYRGDFIELKNSINVIIDSLNNILMEINTAADQVASGTSQVSDGNQEISQGATEQASSIEELSSSITQIADQIKNNAENASTSTELATKARDAANDGNEKMKRMLQSMEEINESSSSISKIIKVIDDIAFQTNILALNAAVEAARAGAHGKGFAVVAEEVRNLAARSANAANETTALIEGSIKKVEMGTNIANETAGALSSIVVGAEESAQLLNGIAVASNEQATGIAQINRGIEQLSQVVQTNSATAEQGAAASEELSSQAELLKSLIGNFKLRSGAAAANKKAQDSKKQCKDDTKHEEAVNAKPTIVLSDSEFGKY